MKFGELIEYNKRKIFLQKLCKRWVGRLVPDLFLFSRKAAYEVKASGLQFSFNIVWYPTSRHTLKTNSKYLWTIVPKICAILIFQERIVEYSLHHILCMALIKQFFYMTKTSRENFKYLENEKTNKKVFLIIFEGLQLSKTVSSLRVPLIQFLFTFQVDLECQMDTYLLINEAIIYVPGTVLPFHQYLDFQTLRTIQILEILLKQIM